MIPRKISPRMLRKLMKQMGLKIVEMSDIREVILKHSDGSETVIRDPQVLAMEASGQRILQITGRFEKIEARTEEVATLEEERGSELEISPEDVQLVAEQAGVSEKEARNALIETGGNLAEAILLLRSRRERGG
ncbi:MAG: nascent polypeptide-associated complex protein [Candidatus Baldrarchaeia archaeon]